MTDLPALNDTAVDDLVVMRPPNETVVDDLVIMHPLGLEFKGEMPYAEWEKLVQRYLDLATVLPWWVGDLLNYGERQYGNTYTQAIQWTGKKVQTLMNWKSVAKRVPLETRREELPWSAHEAVAFLPSGDQERWLDRAEEHHWDRETLRSAIRSSKDVGESVSAPPDEINEEDAIPDIDPRRDLFETLRQALYALQENELTVVRQRITQAQELAGYL